MKICNIYGVPVNFALMLLLIGLGGRAGAAQQNADQSQLQIIAGPYLQAPSETEITVVWATNRKCVSKVEYGTESEVEQKTAVASHNGLLDANTTLHRVRITDLKPGTRYYYRAVSTEITDFQPYKVSYGDTIKSKDASFTTLNTDKDRFSFIVLNDRHDKVVPLIQAFNSIKWENVDLVFLNGDMVDYVTNEEQIFRSIVSPCQSVFAGRIPFIFVRGNHDTRGAYARMLMDYFPTATGRFYFSFSHGGMHFVVLDSGEDKADSDKEYAGLALFEPYLEEETRWLKNEVASESFRQAGFRVVLVHIPPQDTKSKDRFSRSQFLFDRWMPLFNAGKIDFMLCGHTHKYAEVRPAQGRNQFPILINGTDNSARIDVTPDRLSISTFNNDGTLKSTLPVISKR